MIIYQPGHNVEWHASQVYIYSNSVAIPILWTICKHVMHFVWCLVDSELSATILLYSIPSCCVGTVNSII
jgi:hypothetical protein